MTYRLQTPPPSLLKHLTVQQTNIDIGNITMSCMITGEERIRGESLLVFAKNSGIGNVSEFSNCVGSHKYSTLVHQNYDLAISLGLTSTPSFVILSEFKSPMVIVGSQPFQTFDYMIKNMVS